MAGLAGKGVAAVLNSVLGDAKKPLNILCLGAHCDDIEIGCGGSLLHILGERSNVNVNWVVFASNPVRRQEAEAGATMFSEGARSLDLKIHDFRDGFLPTEPVRLKEAFEKLKHEIPQPDVIFTHYRHDLHQDHRAVSDLTWNTFRDHLILEYEIPKWDGDMGQPNVFLPISRATGEKKIRLLHEAYASQVEKAWFSQDLFWSLMRIRGMEANASESIAEAFYSRKLVLSV